jgi:2-polyprenyl-3-methyl-5-hydroxy-6-metoxy-1,4-benzoquinol methylase
LREKNLAGQLRFYNREYFEGDRDLSFNRIVETVNLLGNVQGKTVLDLGCGTGEGSELLREHGAEVVCADVARFGLKKCKKKKFMAVRAVAHALPFKQAAFNCLLLMDVIEHIPKNLVPLSLREVRRTTEPGGRIAIHTMPNLFLERFSMVYGVFNRKHWRRWGDAGGHINTYTSWRLENELRSSGLKIKHFRIGDYPREAPFSFLLSPLSRLVRTLLGNDFWVSCAN